MNTPEIENELIVIKELLQVKSSQLNALSEATKAINDNISTERLYELYKQIIYTQIRVNKIALFRYDQAWKPVIWDNKSSEHYYYFPTQSQLEQYKTIRQLNKEEQGIFAGFKYIIPVYHKQMPLAIALLGDINEGIAHQEEELLDFALTLTNVIAVAVENKRLFKQEVEKKQFYKELDLASKVQGMLIPKKLPKNKLYEFAGLYLPYKGIGGDYYDVIHVSKDEFVFCIGDISGKGIAAALVMANLQAYLNATLNIQNFDKRFIEDLNRKIFSITNGENFITLFMGRYNILSRELIYVNAGHVPPVMIQDNKISRMEVGCTLLGIFDELPKIEFGKLVLKSDSTIVCFTDGLTELENGEEDPLGMERIEQFIYDNHRLSPEIFNKMLYNYISKFKGNVLFNDDISILIGKFL